MKTFKIVKAAIFLSLALSIIFLKETYVEYLRYFIGGLIIMYSIDGFVHYAFDRKNGNEHELCESFVELVLGVSTIAFIEHFEIVCVIWAVWSIMREANELQECIELFKERIPFVLSFIESVVVIVFSIMLIVEPGEHHAITHMYLLIVELTTTILFPQFRFLYKKYFKKGKEE